MLYLKTKNKAIKFESRTYSILSRCFFIFCCSSTKKSTNTQLYNVNDDSIICECPEGEKCPHLQPNVSQRQIACWGSQQGAADLSVL